jgi:photosystem II stability/assembly factor-like uncharacterized protein
MEEHKGASKAPKTFSFPDDPLARHEGLKVDREFGSEGQSLTDLRLSALEHARAMPISGEGRWVQLGPTAISGGQTYDPAGTRVLVTGRITSIVVNPTDSNTMYVGAAQGGVWKTTDRGKTWRPTSDNEVSLAIGALAIDPADPQTLYAGTGEGNFSTDSYYGNGVLKTTDGGNSWTRLGSEPFTHTRFCRIVIDPTTPTTLFAATVSAATVAGRDPVSEGGIYRSMDGGTSWSPMTNGLPSLSHGTRGGATDVIIDPQSPQRVYAAIFGKGIYRTDDAQAANPSWTRLTDGLPSGGFSRIALGMAPSDPQTLYALLADDSSDHFINQFYRSTDGGKTWRSISLPVAANGLSRLGKQGTYNLHVAVDPTTPDLVYLSAVSLWKAIYHPGTGAWTLSDIGRTIHADHHAFAFDPVDSLHIYAGSDGGMYTSHDGGITWSDTLNEGLCITQCEFMEQHPTSDAVIFIGTQDNGIEQYRNSPVFYHAGDGDAGFVAIDPVNPRNVLGTAYRLTPRRSTEGGAFDSWEWVVGTLTGIQSGKSLFYPPLTLDQSNPNNSAIGGTKVFLDGEQGKRGWPESVALPGLEMNEFISAINYTNSDLIYVGTIGGKVYRLTRSENEWVPALISANPLPRRWIWDIAPLPDDSNTVIVVMSGFGTAHVWRGTVPASGTAEWTDISGTGNERLSDIPVNALVLDTGEVMYIATDIGVFRTTDGGTTWNNFSQGLPNCAVFDMRLHQPTRLLRVATHGRGVWERKLDTLSMPDVDTFVRDNLMHTGRQPSSSIVTAAFEDPLQHVALGNPAWWWQCADIKIDALEGSVPAYQMNVDEVDYIAFESRLEHRNPQSGGVNRVYVQLHNRGIQGASHVTVKILYADASAGLPDLPTDFWTVFPGDGVDTSHWKPIGTAQTIPLLLPNRPTVLEWEWNTPGTAEHSCFLVVMDCPSDPIPEANKVLHVATLIANEKRIGLKNVHVVNIPASPPGTIYPDPIYWTPFSFSGNPGLRHSITFSQSWGDEATGQHTRQSWNLALMFPKGMQDDLKLEGIVRSTPTTNELKALTSKFGTNTEPYDTKSLFRVENLTEGARMVDVSLLNDGIQVLLMVAPRSEDTANTSVSIVQETEGTVVGGSTFVLRLSN